MKIIKKTWSRDAVQRSLERKRHSDNGSTAERYFHERKNGGASGWAKGFFSGREAKKILSRTKMRSKKKEKRRLTGGKMLYIYFYPSPTCSIPYLCSGREADSAHTKLFFWDQKTATRMRLFSSHHRWGIISHRNRLSFFSFPSSIMSRTEPESILVLKSPNLLSRRAPQLSLIFLCLLFWKYFLSACQALAGFSLRIRHFIGTREVLDWRIIKCVEFALYSLWGGWGDRGWRRTAQSYGLRMSDPRRPVWRQPDRHGIEGAERRTPVRCRSRPKSSCTANWREETFWNATENFSPLWTLLFVHENVFKTRSQHFYFTDYLRKREIRSQKNISKCLFDITEWFYENFLNSEIFRVHLLEKRLCVCVMVSLWENGMKNAKN